MTSDTTTDGCSKHGSLDICGHTDATCPDKTPEIIIADHSTCFRIPRDGFDVPILAVQEHSEGRKPMVIRTQLSGEIKKLLQQRGLDRIPKGQLYFLKATHEDTEFSETLKRFAVETKAQVGLVVADGNTMPFCEINGEKFRILKIPNKFKDIDTKELEIEINKIFIPSKIVQVGDTQFLFMPLIEYIELIDTVTEEESESFLARLQSCKISPSLDLGMANDPTGKQLPESNMARHKGQLYLCDAGDLLHGKWGEEQNPENLEYAREELRKRLKK